MFSDEPFCHLCRRRGDTLSRVAAGKICAQCAERVGSFLLAAGTEVLAKLWRASGERLASQGKRSPISQEELQTHVDLAHAFHEMGLTLSALDEAAHVLASKPGREIREQALQIVFHKSLAPPSLLNQLREWVFPN